ncbi:integral membrane protein, Mpv17/pmp22 family protein [Ceratobasidium theobromae]|uniref:Integral membrane protein, Mpv17/pmp22 family protein n=1 Tax=Ceratobasidium theobromae TaxID=1582974 RepID=A0A5N5QPA0_9AGAM|nr:integral membrane protein, Mpv17/pmp22 family protein [Ceratobasidium theobromae]
MQAYVRLMNARPLLGPCITTAVLFGTGDVVAQQVVDRRGISAHDWVRTARLSLYGGAIFAPIVTNCCSIACPSSQNPPSSHPGSVYAPVLYAPLSHPAQVGLDQFAFAPIAVGLFFTCTSLMEGKSLADVKKKLDQVRLHPFPVPPLTPPSRTRTPSSPTGLFIPFQTINMFVPLHHRLLAVNAVSIPWNAYLSFKGATAVKGLPTSVA